MNTITISEGKTNSLILPAVIGLFVGAVVCVFIPVAGIILLAFALSLFLATTGIELSPTGKQYRKYTDYFGLKSGVWRSVDSLIAVDLKLSSENGTYYHRLGERSHKSITYDLIAEDQLGKQQTIYEFMEYKTAKQALKAFGEAFQVQITDHIAVKMQENRLKRGSR